MADSAPPSQYGQQPTLKDRLSQSISRNAPAVMAKIIQQTMYAFIKLWRFIGEMLHDAIGR